MSPLRVGKSHKIFSENVGEMMRGPQHERMAAKHGKETAHKMAIAAAYAQQRKARKRKGK